jgi:hypothetical protein
MENDFLLEVAREDMEEPFLIHNVGRHTYVAPHTDISYNPCETINKYIDKTKTWIQSINVIPNVNFIPNVNVIPTLNVLQLLNFFTFLGFFIYYIIAPKSIDTIYVPASFGCVLVQMAITLIKEWVLIEGASPQPTL